MSSGVIVRVSNRVRIYGAPDAAIAELKNKFTHANPDYGKASRYGVPPRGMITKYVTWQHDADGAFSIPRGGVVRMRNVFDRYDVTYEVIDERERGLELAGGYAISRKLYEHQQQIVDVGIESEQSLVRAPTGCGKSLAALAYILRAGRWALVVVPTNALAVQWKKAAKKEIGISDDDLGMIGDGKCNLRPITLALPTSLARMADSDELRVFGTFVFDEVHRAAAASFCDAVDHSPARYRLGVSADERRKDKKEFLVRDMFGAVAVDISRDDLIEKKIVLDVQVQMVPTKFEALWYAVIAEKGKVAREMIESGKQPSPKVLKQLQFEEQTAFTKLLAEMTVDEERNAIVREIGARAIARGYVTLAFTHRREHAEVIRSLVAASDPRVGLMLGGSKRDAKEFESTCVGIESGEICLGVGTYQSMGTGIDLPAVSRGICTTPCHTNRGFFGQVRGRLCRMGSDDAVLWYLWDERVFGNAPLRAMLKWNREVYVFRGGALVDGRVDLASNGNDQPK